MRQAALCTMNLLGKCSLSQGSEVVPVLHVAWAGLCAPWDLLGTSVPSLPSPLHLFGAASSSSSSVVSGLGILLRGRCLPALRAEDKGQAPTKVPSAPLLEEPEVLILTAGFMLFFF